MPGPGIEDDRLSHFYAGNSRSGVHNQSQGIASWDVNGGGVSSSEHRHREAHRGKVGIEVRARGQDRHEHAIRVASAKARSRNLLQTESFGGWSVAIPMDRQGVHRFGKGFPQGRKNGKGPASVDFGLGSGHDSSLSGRWETGSRRGSYSLLRFTEIASDS